jgi:hypothetical protein
VSHCEHLLSRISLRSASGVFRAVASTVRAWWGTSERTHRTSLRPFRGAYPRGSASDAGEDPPAASSSMTSMISLRQYKRFGVGSPYISCSSSAARPSPAATASRRVSGFCFGTAQPSPTVGVCGLAGRACAVGAATSSSRSRIVCTPPRLGSSRPSICASACVRPHSLIDSPSPPSTGTRALDVPGRQQASAPRSPATSPLVDCNAGVVAYLSRMRNRR